VTEQAIHDEVKAYYADAAKSAECGRSACCGPDPSPWGTSNYDHLDDDLPTAAAHASLGCGNPMAVAELEAGDTVLDLGSGGGIDVLLSARRVGPGGFVYGLDMTPEMLDLARRNAAEASATNVEFLLGQIEEVPLLDAAVGVVISNCVINLSPDKPRVFAEMYRVLRPGGRVGVSDVVTDDDLTDDERTARGTFAGCIAGALPISTYRAGLHDAGFTDVDITITHTVADGVHAAIIRATKPAVADGECCS
jgi:SAM-dependent methyltransferase